MALAFSPARTYLPANQVRSVTAVDINNDGILDIIATSAYTGVLAILGDGAGGFSGTLTFSAGMTPVATTVADLNSDGRPDLIIVDQGGVSRNGIVSVLLANGAGGFGSPTTYAAGTNPSSVVVADLNRDGVPDVIVTDNVVSSNGAVSILLGNGTGGFSSDIAYSAGINPMSASVADLNQDGLLDILVADTSSSEVDLGAIAVLLGNGIGGISSGYTYGPVDGPTSLVAVDLNGDGKTDVVSVNLGDNAVEVLLGNGTGGFSSKVLYGAGNSPVAVAVADMNGDGKLDLVAAGSGTVAVLLGDGAGGFSLPTTYSSVQGGSSVTTADINGDGKPDIIVGGVNGVSVLLNQSTAFNLSSRPNSFNGDNRSELLFQGDGSTVLVTYQSSGLVYTGAALVTGPGVGWHLIGSADLDGDGSPDLVFQNVDGRVLGETLTGTTVHASGILANPGAGWHVRAIADFTGDRRADVLLQNTNGSLELAVTGADGTSSLGLSALGTYGSTWHVEGAGDFDGDGKVDGILQNDDGRVGVVLQANLAAGVQVLGNPGPGATIAGTGDYNGDGKTDALVHMADGTVLLGTISGATVTALATIGNPGASYTAVVAGGDYNADGKLDVAVQSTDGTVALATLNGSSTATITTSAVLGQLAASTRVVGNVPTMFLDGSAPGTLTGTPGTDAFLLSTPSIGTHTITSFDPVLDRVVLSAASFGNYAGMQAREVPYQGGTYIGVTTSVAVIIQGLLPQQLTAANFAFV